MERKGKFLRRRRAKENLDLKYRASKMGSDGRLGNQLPLHFANKIPSMSKKFRRKIGRIVGDRGGSTEGGAKHGISKDARQKKTTKNHQKII